MLLVIGAAALTAALVLAVLLLPGVPVTRGGQLIASLPGVARRPERDPVEPSDPAELSSLLRRLARLGARFAPRDYARRVQHRLDLAGNPRNWGPDRLLAFKGAGLVTGVALGLVVGAKHGPAMTLLLALAFGVFALFVPDILVRNLGEKRQIELRKGLPDVLDVLLVSVEAGLGFDAAIGRVARNLEGPMAEECARVLQEMQFGLSRTEALRALLERTDVPELRTFVAAVIQSGELGVSIADVLREQAKEVRMKRRQRAEEKAQKLQVKLLMPLIACLLPVIFIVVLGPAALQIMHFFHTANR